MPMTVLGVGLALLGLGLTTASVVIGWFVTGTQRVTEELTKERRQAYRELLAQTDDLRGWWTRDPALAQPPRRPDPREVKELRRLASAAQLLSSEEMLSSGRLSSLIQAAVDDDASGYETARDEFLTAARLDSHRNSSRLRKNHRGAWYELPAGSSDSSGV